MNNMTEEVQLTMLDIIGDELESEISSFVVETREVMWDEEESEHVMAVGFNRGTNTHHVVFSPLGHIKWFEKTTPKMLVAECGNAIISLMHDIYESETGVDESE